MKKQVSSKIVLLTFSIFFLILAIFFSSQPALLKEEKTFFQLGTYVRITIYPAKKVNSFLIFNRCQEIMGNINSKSNFFDSSSELSKLNQKKGKECSVELKELIKLAKSAARKTEGFFDPTIGPLTDLWSDFISYHKKLPPSNKEIEKAKCQVDYKKINFKGNKVILSKEQKIDLSGVNKGFAVDMLSNYLKKLPLRGFVIDMTSSVMVWGEKPDKKNFLIALKNPRPVPKKEYLALIPLFSGEYLSTSADNQQFRFFQIKKGGKVFFQRYHHLISPQTGYPADNFQSVTVISKSGGAHTDALSTALFVMKKEKAVEFINKNKLKVITVDQNGKVEMYNLRERDIRLF